MKKKKPKVTTSGYIVKIGDIFIFSTFRTREEDAESEMHDSWLVYKEAKVVKIKIIEQ